MIKTLDPSMDAYCAANGPRPLLSYGAKGTRIGRKTFLFVAALKQWEKHLDKMDLTEAYKHARSTFTGKMEQIFVVLKEEASRGPVTGANQVAVGVKRAAEESLASEAKK